MGKVRFEYLDIARGLGILMVVWAHIMITGWTHEMFYAFHMPLFFFLSGMVFKRERYKTFSDFFIHRAKRLFIPYVIYSVATWIFWAAFRYIRHDEVESYIMPLLQTFIAQGSGAFMVHNSALWFIPSLFLAEIIYYFLSKIGNTWGILISFALASLSFIFGYIYGDNYWFLLPWNADAALIALPFYAVGNNVIKSIGHEKLIKSVSANRKSYLLAVLVMTGLLLWSATTFGECSMGSSSYQCSPWVFILRAFLGIAWLINISLLLGQIRRPKLVTSTVIKYTKWAGINSLDIMCLHIPLKGVCMILVSFATHATVNIVSGNYLLSFISFVMTMIGAWLIIKVARRFF